MLSTLAQKPKKPAVGVAKKKRSFSEDSSSSSDDGLFNEAQTRKPRRGRPKRPRSHVPVEKFGDYILKYQDDKTGSRNIHPTALRFALGIVEDLARDTTASVSKSLRDDGELVSENYDVSIILWSI